MEPVKKAKDAGIDKEIDEVILIGVQLEFQ